MRLIAAAAGLNLIIHVGTGYNATANRGEVQHPCFLQLKPFKHELPGTVRLLRLFSAVFFCGFENRGEQLFIAIKMPFRN